MTGTTHLESACGRTWDAIVLGAGPAGSVAARTLAASGKSVLLLDRSTFPRRKVCGCCLNGAAVHALREAEMSGVLAITRAQPLTRMRVFSGMHSGTIALSDSWIVSREALDAALIASAVDAGASFLPGVSAHATHVDDETRTVEIHAGSCRGVLRGKLVLAATGLHSSFLDTESSIRDERSAHSHIGVGATCDSGADFYEPHTAYMSTTPHGYGGIVRLEDGRLNIAAAIHAPFVQRCGGPEFAIAELLQAAGLPPVQSSHYRGTPLLSHRRSCVTAARLFVLGDAAGYVEPFTGEGMAWAMASGFLAARIAANPENSPVAVLEQNWQRAYRDQIQKRQRPCKVVAGLLRSPALTHATLSLLEFAPALSQALVRALNAPLVPSLQPALAENGPS